VNSLITIERYSKCLSSGIYESPDKIELGILSFKVRIVKRFIFTSFLFSLHKNFLSFSFSRAIL